jgi:hypothetical protein
MLATVAPSQKMRHRSASKRSHFTAWGVPEIFSDLALEPETGDVGGIEVILIPSYYNDWATVVIGDSIPENPVLVPVTRNGNKIEFTLPPDRPGGSENKYTGTITRAGLRLQNKDFGVQLIPRQWRSR